MTTSHRRSGWLALAVIGAGVAVAAWWPRSASAAVETMLQLVPGDSAEVVLGADRLAVSVPAGPDESASIGSFRITDPGGSFDSGPLPREGFVERCIVGDVDGDGAVEAVLVVRSAGSGSYVELFVVRRAADGLGAIRLPSPDPALRPGAMGHDHVEVAGGRLWQTAPIYADREGLRVDRNWRPADALQGALPVKVAPDGNADPSGGHCTLWYDFTAGRWRRDG